MARKNLRLQGATKGNRNTHVCALERSERKKQKNNNKKCEMTKSDERTASVRGDRLAVRNLASDDLLLELVVLEHLERLLLSNLQTLKVLLLLDDAVHVRLERRKVALAKGAIGRVAVIVEAAVLRRRPDAQVRAKLRLDRLAENMRRRMPESEFAVGRVEVAQHERARLLERPHEVPRLPVDERDDHARRHALGNVGRNLERCRHKGDRVHDVAVGQRHLDDLCAQKRAIRKHIVNSAVRMNDCIWGRTGNERSKNKKAIGVSHRCARRSLARP